MPYPAASDTFFEYFGSHWSLNGVFSSTVSIPISVSYNIHPASANANQVRGFKLCRGWSKTFGMIRRNNSGHAKVVREFIGTSAKDVYDYPTGHDAWYWGGGSSYIPPLPGLPGSNMKNATLTACLEKLKDQDIHVGNFIAEADKTFSMFAHAARSIANAVSAFRGKYPKDWLKVTTTETGRLARDKWCEIPNKWLELQYGWKPLMSDVFGAIHHITRKSRYTVPYVFAKKHKSDSSEFTANIKLHGGSGNAFPDENNSADLTFTDKLDCWVQLVYGITSPHLAELSSLGLIDPLEIIWEVTPYSFVVDWFLPISSWLSALTADVGFDFVTGCMSTKAVRKFKGAQLKGPFTPSYTQAGSKWTMSYPTPPTFSGSIGVFDRTCYTSSPVPGLYVKNPLSAVHVANAMSLLVQAFKR